MKTNVDNEPLNFGNPAALMAALSGDMKNALVAATPGGIEAQEKAGQRPTDSFILDVIDKHLRAKFGDRA